MAQTEQQIPAAAVAVVGMVLQPAVTAAVDLSLLDT
jgi:hypothetical protein